MATTNVREDSGAGRPLMEGMASRNEQGESTVNLAFCTYVLCTVKHRWGGRH